MLFCLFFHLRRDFGVVADGGVHTARQEHDALADINRGVAAPEGVPNRLAVSEIRGRRVDHHDVVQGLTGGSEVFWADEEIKLQREVSVVIFKPLFDLFFGFVCCARLTSLR